MDTKSSESSLLTSLEFMKGIGSQRAALLQRLGLRNARDVLFHFPREYQDLSELCDITQLAENRAACICGVVEEIELRNSSPGKSTLGVLIRQESQYLRAIWFNQPFMRHKFANGKKVLLSGTPRQYGLRWEMMHPSVEVLQDDEQPTRGRILPVYPLTDGIQQATMRRLVERVVVDYADRVPEVLPPEFRTQHQLMPIADAIRGIHQPSDHDQLASARHRFVYQELLVMQLALAMRRSMTRHGGTAPAMPDNAKIAARILRRFPFELTSDQRQAIQEISDDLNCDSPMNRLLQGDVGCGKTVVALYAMLLSVAHGYQAVLMAPTEILARQHQLTLTAWLRDSRVRFDLITGSRTTADRRQLASQIEAGELDLIVGTQAVLNRNIQFKKLGLVVIDEQHKFGVRQRAQLRNAGLDPHYLIMTATPIPRTVSMTQFGDLDVSLLRERPPGRQIVHSYRATEANRAAWWEFFRRKLREGRQGFVISPLVDDSSQQALVSAEEAFEQLANGELEAFRIDLIHGQQRPEWKDEVMSKFRSGETQVLVATSVVEVGVDVPNATLMTIEHGERFGLAQLHQLRGRISRGSFPGYLSVFSDSDSGEACERITAFVSTNDGFELAEKDLQLRGPGDLFGLRQHGLPALRIANLQSDTETLEEARRHAQCLIEKDPDLAEPAVASLRKMVIGRYGRALELGDVG